MIQGAPLHGCVAGSTPSAMNSADCRRAERERGRRFLKRCLAAFGALTFTVNPNVILTPQGPTLQLAGYQPVFRVGYVVLALRPGGLVASLLQRQFELIPFFGALLAARFDHGQHRLDAQRLQSLEPFFGEDPVDAHSSECEASRCCELVESAHAFVAIGLAIANVELLAAARAAKETG